MSLRKLGGTDYILQVKSGLKTDINTTATKNKAVEGELHYCTDTDELFIFNGTENVQIGVLDAASETLYSGTFEDNTGATVTVVNGLITDVT